MIWHPYISLKASASASSASGSAQPAWLCGPAASGSDGPAGKSQKLKRVGSAAPRQADTKKSKASKDLLKVVPAPVPERHHPGIVGKGDAYDKLRREAQRRKVPAAAAAAPTRREIIFVQNLFGDVDSDDI